MNDESIGSAEFRVWASEMRLRLYAFWKRDIWDDEVILDADPMLKIFADRLPGMGIDQCETFKAWAEMAYEDYSADPEPPVLDDEDEPERRIRRASFCPAPEPDAYDTWRTHLLQVQAEKAMAALLKSKAMLKALAATAQPSAAPQRAMPEAAAVSGQTAAAQHTSTGGSSSEDGDPDPADQIIIDPCKTDPRVLTHGDNPTARNIRKALMAIRMDVRHPAADYYVQRALAEMVKQVKHRVRCMPFRIPADIVIPLILDAALSLLYGLAGKHDFQRRPNPNFYNIVKRNIQVPANLREVANRLLGAESKKLDMLDVEAGLARAEDGDHACAAARLSPITDADGEVAEEEAVDVLPSRDIQDDPELSTWVLELASLGQVPHVDDDPDGAISAALAAEGISRAAFDNIEGVLTLVAGLTAAVCRDRAFAIFEAMGFLDGCATAQHRASKLRAVVRNACGSYSPELQRAATNLLEGAGFSA